MICGVRLAATWTSNFGAAASRHGLDLARAPIEYCVTLADALIQALRAAKERSELVNLMEAVTREFGFRHYALIHHVDLRSPKLEHVDLKDYPDAITHRIFGQARYRRDPIIRGCAFSESAFLWSELNNIIRYDKHDRACFEAGAREGLNEGITVPYSRLGDYMGSCTFAGTTKPELATRYLGLAQMVGIFAFQAARRLRSPDAPMSHPRLHPRPRDCVVLAGQGRSNKQIARALALAPRTVDGYLTEARRLFNAHSRAELIVSALFAGEISLHELRPRQPE
jgi:DNA-binding CsgD family transcriptional regulator